MWEFVVFSHQIVTYTDAYCQLDIFLRSMSITSGHIGPDQKLYQLIFVIPRFTAKQLCDNVLYHILHTMLTQERVYEQSIMLPKFGDIDKFWKCTGLINAIISIIWATLYYT